MKFCTEHGNTEEDINGNCSRCSALKELQAAKVSEVIVSDANFMALQQSRIRNPKLSCKIEDLENKNTELEATKVHLEEKLMELLIEKRTANEENPKVQILWTGASRVPVREAFHLICPELERRLALICAEGLKNYQLKEIPEAELTTACKGMPLDNLNKHLMRHYNKWRFGDRSEDHLAKVIWAIQQIFHQETNGECQHIKMFVTEEHKKLVL